MGDFRHIGMTFRLQMAGHIISASMADSKINCTDSTSCIQVIYISNYFHMTFKC